MDLHWIDSAGGPLICGNRATARHWRGANASSTGASASDYERACQSTEYLSLVACGSGDVLVLGDEPLQSAFMQSSGGLAIVRWVSCESHAAAASALNTLPPSLPSLEGPIRFKVDDEGLLMFDSAEDCAGEFFSVAANALPGDMLVTTEKYESPGRFEFLVHRFIRT